MRDRTGTPGNTGLPRSLACRGQRDLENHRRGSGCKGRRCQCSPRDQQHPRKGVGDRVDEQAGDPAGKEGGHPPRVANVGRTQHDGRSRVRCWLNPSNPGCNVFGAPNHNFAGCRRCGPANATPSTHAAETPCPAALTTAAALSSLDYSGPPVNAIPRREPMKRLAMPISHCGLPPTTDPWVGADLLQ